MKRTELLDLNGSWELHMYPDKDSGMYRDVFSDPGRLTRLLPEAIPAEVPGSFELDLQRAGVIPDPYVGMNMLSLEKYEYYHLVYTRTFDLDEVPDGSELLCFEGIDTFADIWLNGKQAGSTDNMLISHELPAAALRRGRNILAVHIYPTVLRARENSYTALAYALKYNYDSLFVRKTASMFGWDICPRMVSGGLWRPVSLIRKAQKGFVQLYFCTERLELPEKAVLQFFYEVAIGSDEASAYRVEVKGSCGSSEFAWSSRVWGKAGKDWIAVPDPRLWYPRGYGDQPLYDVTVSLLCNGEVVDEQHLRIGIRVVKLLRTGCLDENGQGEFCFEFNGRRVFVLGTNWVPPDAHQALGDVKAPEILDQVIETGCNAIRIWGGGRYERDEFYSLCDEKGILVWHDLMMACGNYPQTESFREALTKEVVQVVRSLRHHPCICLWAGDNECDMNYRFNVSFTDPNDNPVTRQWIYRILLNEDYSRPYLPSSPFYDSDLYRSNAGTPPEEHLWGDRRYYKAPFYRDATALFASEMGYHGCPSPDSIREFISPEKVWDYRNEEWLLHASCPDPAPGEPFAYRNELMASQVEVLFGEIPDELERFALASQISQAEALQFFIQHFRSRKGHCTGIIWWNIRDAWPQISDAVVDYYGRKKLSFGYVRRCQQPVCLMIEERKEGTLSLYGVNDTGREETVSYCVRNAGGDAVMSGSAAIPCDRAVLIDSVPAVSEKELWKISWENGRLAGDNTFLTGSPVYSLDRYVEEARKLGVLDIEGFRQPGAVAARPCKGE